MEKKIGKVVHCFDKAMVAVVGLTGKLSVGDAVKFSHGGKEFSQKVNSIQVEHKPVKSGKAGEEVAIKTDEATHEHAEVYKIEE